MFERYEEALNFRLVEIEEAEHGWLRAIHRRLPLWVRRRLLLHAPNVIESRHADVLTRAVDILYVPYVPPPRLFPFPDAPTVYSIHDIQQVRYPEFFTAEERVEREGAFRKCVEHASVVQASSHFMAREFQGHFSKLNESNVEVIPEGVDIERFSLRQHDDDVVMRHKLPSSFLFTPAQLWHHKNHRTVLKALIRLKDQGRVIPWVLTGARYSSSNDFFDTIAANGLEEQIFYLGVVPFEDIVALHQRARYLVTASLYESSSIPILEAAAAGTPIIASRIPPHEEMAEQLEMRFFTPDDDAELADVLEVAWTDFETGSQQATTNRVAVQRYSWDNAARMYLALFERLRTQESG
jgi:glycosyltransferase involved in cell wall biosynthesis